MGKRPELQESMIYCTAEVLKLAFKKGYTKCTCSAGGYPECICDNIPYGNVRLDDIQKWLRDNKDIDIEIRSYIDYDKITRIYDWTTVTELGPVWEKDEYFSTYEIALEEAIKYALTLI